MFSQIYHTVLSEPLLNLLVFFYNLLFSDIALAIIAVTVLIRLILYPSFKHQLESQKKLSEIQPKLQELRDKHKDNPEAQSRAMMEFYKENKVNPFSSCLPMIVQLVILLALYRVFLTGLGGQGLPGLYSFIQDPSPIDTVTLGVDLAQKNIVLAVITGAVQFVQSKLMTKFQPKPQSGGGQMDMAGAMTKQMVYVFPIITIVIGAQLPGGLVLYWLITTLFAIGQQWIIINDKSK